MVSLFNWMQKSKASSVKRSKFRKFLDTFCRPQSGDDYFSAIRLILPSLDRERGSYGLREHVLATCLIDALGMSRDSPDSQRLLNWRKGGPKSGAFAGNFSLIAAEVSILAYSKLVTCSETFLWSLISLINWIDFSCILSFLVEHLFFFFLLPTASTISEKIPLQFENVELLIVPFLLVSNLHKLFPLGTLWFIYIGLRFFIWTRLIMCNFFFIKEVL